jgi:hypothetical protein
MHTCRFSAGFDELTRKQQRDPKVVLETLQRLGRFSVFEATENQGIATTLTLLLERGLFNQVSIQYPWLKVEITEAGEKFLTDGAMPAAPDPFEGMVRVSKRTYVSQSIAEERGLKEWRPK